MKKVTISGAEMKEFWDDQAVWSEDTYTEQLTLNINGVDNDDADIDKLNPTDVVIVTGGYFCDENTIEPPELVDVIKTWRKKKTTKTLLIEVDAADEDALLAHIKAFRKAKVIR